MTKLPRITYQKIVDLDPCYDPIKHISENWDGTALDILNIKGPSISDKLWVVLNEGFIPDKILHEYACRCAEHVLHLYEAKYPDDLRPRKAIEAKRKWAKGEMTDKQLAAARDAAWAASDAAWAAARDARDARAAAWAASDAASDAAWAAASDAASDAAWAAARAARDAARDARDAARAAWVAAWAAARDAARAASDAAAWAAARAAASDAARDAEEQWQLNMLIALLRDEVSK